jgi:hypothetical protein
MIVTSNLDLEAISAEIDDRVASRLSEACEIIKLDGADHRVIRPATQCTLTEVMQ